MTMRYLGPRAGGYATFIPGALSANASIAASVTANLSADFGSNPFNVVFDEPAINSIGLEVELLSSYADDDHIRVRYSPTGQGAWIQAPDLLNLRPQYPKESGRLDFSGIVTGLQPGTSYDIELSLHEIDGSLLSQTVETTSTLALLPANPAEAILQQVSTSSQLISALSGVLSAGTIVELADGVYDIGQELLLRGNGSQASPIYLRSQSGNRGDCVIRFDIQSTERIDLMTLNGARYWVFEDLTVQPGTSLGDAKFTDLRYIDASNIEVRNCVWDHEYTFHVSGRVPPEYSGTGDEEGVFEISDSSANNSCSWYNNTFVGPWTYATLMSLYTDSSRGGTNSSWDFVPFKLHGSGHTIAFNTISGFGDTGKVSTSSGRQANICVHNNLVEYCGDDGFEFDDATGNCAAYENMVVSTSSGWSTQPNNAHGGPYDIFRNAFIGQREAIAKIKPSSNPAAGVRFIHNTHVAGTKGFGPGIGVSNDAGVNIIDTNAEPRNCWVLNNVFCVDRGSRTTKYMRNLPGWDDFHSIGGWNLHYPDGSQNNDFETNGQSRDTLAEVQQIRTAMVQDSLATYTNPLANVDSLTMGATPDGQQVPYDVSLTIGSAARGLGVELRGFNSGTETFYVAQNGTTFTATQPGNIDVGALQFGDAMFAYGDAGVAPPQITQVGKWQKDTVEIAYSGYSGNAFEIEFEATFTHATAPSITMPGFYAGSDLFKINFMPTELGTWSYTTSCVTDAALDGQTGSFECIASSLAGQLVADGRKWKYADSGEYLIPIVCRMHSFWKIVSETDFKTARDYLIDDVGAQFFDTPMTIEGDSDNPQFVGPPTNHVFDVANWDRMEQYLEWMAERNAGYYFMFYADDQGVPTFAGQSTTEALLVRYAVARFAAHPLVLWDYGIDIAEYRNQSDIDWFGGQLDALDPYGHLHSSRYGGGSGNLVQVNQTWHSYGFKQAEIAEMRSAYNDYAVPLGMSDSWGEDRTRDLSKIYDPPDLRRAYWKAVLAGGAGGWFRSSRSQQSGTFDFAATDTYSLQNDLDSEQWLSLVNPFVVNNLGAEFISMEPDTGVVSGSGAYAIAPPSRQTVLIMQIGTNDRYDTGSQTVNIDVSGVAAGTYRARWFNPRNGAFTNVGSGTLASATTHNLTTPDNDDWLLLLDNYQVDQGGGGDPNWFQNMAAWEVVDSVQDLGSNTIDDLDPNHPISGSQAGVIDAWNSGAYDTLRNQLLVYGGGHGDYGGNEVYAFGPLTGASPTWSIFKDASNPLSGGDGLSYSDGGPRPPHTYDSLVYAENTDEFIAVAGAGPYPDSDNSGYPADLFKLNMSTREWSRHSFDINNHDHKGSACYDSASGRVYYAGAGDQSFPGSGWFDPTDNSFASVQSIANISFGGQVVMACKPGEYMAGNDDGSKTWSVVRLSDMQRFSPGTTGASWGGNQGGGSQWGESAVAYDPLNDVFYLWQSGDELIEMQPPADPYNDTWTAVSRGLSGRSMGSAPQTGTFKRMRYVPDLHALVLINSTTTGVKVIKLPTPIGGTTLETVANSLSPGEWQYVSTNFASEERSDSTNEWQWSSALAYDRLNQQIVCIPQEVSSHPWPEWRYDIQANSFNRRILPFPSSFGHGYDQLTSDVANGKLWFVQWVTGRLWEGTWSGSNYSWSQINYPSGNDGSGPHALCWYPEGDNGNGVLVMCTDGYIQYRKSDGTWFDTGVSGGSLDRYWYAKYAKSQGVVVAGYGGGASENFRDCYVLAWNTGTDSLDVTKVSDSPYSCTQNQAAQAYDFRTNRVLGHSDGTFYQYDPDTDNWSSVTGWVNKPTFTGSLEWGQLAMTGIEELDCMVAFIGGNPGAANAGLWIFKTP